MNKKILGIALVLFTLVAISSVFAEGGVVSISTDGDAVYVRNTNPKNARNPVKISGEVCITVEHKASGQVLPQDEPYEDIVPGQRKRIYKLSQKRLDEGWRITGASLTTCYVVPYDPNSD